VRYLTVKNWAEFQHYKDRNPPWIKLHRALLDDYEFGRLQDASKAHLMLIWLFASSRDGRIPDDPKFLQAKLGLDKQPDLTLLTDQGFLIPERSASNTLQTPEHGDCNVLSLARSREERREDTEKRHARFARFWSEYPKKVAKPDAVKAWAKLEPDDVLTASILVALERQKKSGQWHKDGGQYIPNPATWLNKRRWEDEPAVSIPQPFPA
jgi:hypothetical protein